MEQDSQKHANASRDEFRRLTILIAVATLDLTGAAMIFPLMPLYAKAMKIPSFSIGVIMASFYVAQLIAAPVWGRVSDRYGRRPALLVGLAALGMAQHDPRLDIRRNDIARGAARHFGCDFQHETRARHIRIGAGGDQDRLFGHFSILAEA